MPTKTKKPAAPLPVPVKQDSRICFGIYYFASEKDARAWAKAHRGSTYNGGYFHGMPCGREPSRDYTDDTGRRLYAVTD